ncbi:hypothetical protein BJX63DRAFT_437123 [Aspergillus granulosus]|uniref:Uncharacterized protein n=1 Tax=Aspergillus granulosus TaxID=176169 RepID=A0ABR4GXL0_9EURO
MAALIFCSPSRSEALEYYSHYEGGSNGMVFPERSYWRVRSILGRVLGCIPGVVSVAGWIGPCPDVEGFEVPRTFYLASTQLAPVDLNKLFSDHVWQRGRFSSTTLAADLRDGEQWIIPQPPATRSHNCKLLSIRLEQLPIRKELRKIEELEGGWDEKQKKSRREFHAHIHVEIDGDSRTPLQEEYTLLYSSIFVSLLPCLPDPDRAHKEHVSRLTTMEVPVEKLKDKSTNVSTDKIIVIKATGKGAKIAARAWCSEVGRNAVVRTAGGPFMSCTLRGASRVGLDLGTVI